MVKAVGYVEKAQMSDDAFRKFMLKREAEADEKREKTIQTRRHNKDEEHRLQVECVTWFRMSPKMRRWQGLLFAIPNGGKRETKSYTRRDGVVVNYCPEGKKLKDEGALAGVADMMLAVASHEYHGLFIEFKIEDKASKQSEGQKEFERKVEEQGYMYKVVRKREEFEELIEWWFWGG